MVGRCSFPFSRQGSLSVSCDDTPTVNGITRLISARGAEAAATNGTSGVGVTEGTIEGTIAARILDRRDRLSLYLSLPFMLGIALGKGLADRIQDLRFSLWHVVFGFLEGRGSPGGIEALARGPYSLLAITLVTVIMTAFAAFAAEKSKPRRVPSKKKTPRCLLSFRGLLSRFVARTGSVYKTLIPFFLASCLCGVCRYTAFRITGEGDIARALQGEKGGMAHVFQMTVIKCTPLDGMPSYQDERANGDNIRKEVNEEAEPGNQTEAYCGWPDIRPAMAFSRFQVIGNIYSIDGRRVFGRALVILDAKTSNRVREGDPSKGSIISVRGSIRRPEGSRNPGLPGEEDRVERLGAFWIIDSTSWWIESAEYCGGRGREVGSFTEEARSIGFTKFLHPAGSICDSVEETARRLKRGVLRLADRIRFALMRKMSLVMPTETAGFYRAILLGDRSCVSQEMSSAFSVIGLSHILALSGLHVVLVAGGLRWTLKAFKTICARLVIGIFGEGRRSSIRLFIFSPVTEFALTATLLVVYAMIAGGAPSVFRASFMFISAAMGPLVGRRSSSMNALWFSALVILVFSPQCLFDIGFQLSFMATWGILKYNRRFQRLVPWCPAEVTMTVSSQLSTLPILAGAFGRFSVISFIANPLMLPFVALLVNYGLILLILCTIWPATVKVLQYPASWGVFLLAASSKFMASLPLSSLVVFRPHWLLLITYYALVWIWSFSETDSAGQESSVQGSVVRCYTEKGRWTYSLRGLMADKYPIQSVYNRSSVSGRRKNVRGILLALVIVLLWVIRGFDEIMPGMMEVTFFDVGQGDGALIRTADRVILVDTGPDTDGSLRRMAELLRVRGVGHIDYLVLSHGHSDHIGGFEGIIKTFSVGAILIPESQVDTKEFKDIIRRASSKNTRVIALGQGDILEFGNRWPTTDGFVRKMNTITLTVLHPQKGHGEGIRPTSEPASDFMNETSLVFCLDFGRQRFIWTGDIGASTEKKMLESRPWLEFSKLNILSPETGRISDKPGRTVILKVAHHGASTSTTDRFLDEMAPAVAVIQVGENDFGHPGKEVLDRLASRGIVALRTDKNGAITFRTDGKRWFARTWICFFRDSSPSTHP
ncbi:MAG TPA: MBL fold metallo-hydrolase [Clostridia bacterium]|nr:MBL fold metallo-hydrolase [Clostridia bacterium]